MDTDELSLVLPDSKGNLNTAVFKPATVADYNNSVFNLRGDVEDFNAKEQEIKAQANEIYNQQEAVKNANKKLSNSLDKLTNLNQQLKNVSHFDDILKEYQTHWNKMQEHQKNMKALANKKPFDSYQLTEVQYALTEVEYALTEIQYDDTSMEYRANEITSNIKAIQKQIDTVDIDLVNLQSAASANTTGSPAAQFTLNDVQTVVAQAQKQTEASSSALKKTQQQAKDYDTKANKLVEESRKFVEGLKPID